MLLLVYPVDATLFGQTFRLPADLAQLQEFARTDSTEATAHYFVGLGWWDAGKLPEADSALRRAITIDPRFADAYLALAYLRLFRWRSDGRVNLRDGNVILQSSERREEAERLGRRAFLINPLVDLPVVSGRGSSFAAMFGGSYAELFDEIEREARRYNERKHPERVPREIRWVRGMVAARLDKHDLAITDFEALLAWAIKADTATTFAGLAFTANQFRYLLAVFNHRAGRLERAKELYRTAAEMDLGLYMAHVQLAGIYTEEGKLDSAVAERRIAALVDPDDSSVHVELAVTLLQAGLAHQAVEPLIRAGELNRHDARVPYLLGVIAATGGQVDEARGYLTHFLAIAPSRMADQVTDARRRLAELP